MHYDVIIIGSGAGGSAAAYKLALAGKQVLLVEKGKPLPADGSTQDCRKVIRLGLFKSRETWLDAHNRTFMPEEYFNLGGKTKWYGAALLRFHPAEFEADSAFGYLPWPIGYAELEPFYQEAETLLGVHVFAVEADLKALNHRLLQQHSGWQSLPLPLALHPSIAQDELEARHFDGFASTKNLKADAEVSLLQKAAALPNFTVITGQPVANLLGDADQPARLAGVMLGDGRFFSAQTIVLAAGAMHSPRLLLDYLNRSGLASTLMSAQTAGRYFKRHILTAMLAFSPGRKTDRLRKTVFWLHPEFAHSSVQPLGFSADALSALFPAWMPRRLASWLSQFTYGFFLQTEDGSHPGNKISVSTYPHHNTLPKLDYDPQRILVNTHEHSRMVAGFRKALQRAGCICLTKAIPLAGTAHACGTLVTGNDPKQSVVDSHGKVHGMENLYVADGSILPRSSRVNPALTIYAWGLRLGSHLLNTGEAAI